MYIKQQLNFRTGICKYYRKQKHRLGIHTHQKCYSRQEGAFNSIRVNIHCTYIIYYIYLKENKQHLQNDVRTIKMQKQIVWGLVCRIARKLDFGNVFSLFLQTVPKTQSLKSHAPEGYNFFEPKNDKTTKHFLRLYHQKKARISRCLLNS